MNSNRNVSIIKDIDGNKIVVINDIIFKGKRSINWDDVELYLKRYVGEFYTIEETNEIIYIGSDLPDEYAHSNYTHNLKGSKIKIKANAAQGIPELIRLASSKSFKPNLKSKHNKNAKLGWYRYESNFALPVYDINNNIVKFNVYKVALIIRHANNGKKYLYDIIDIKKK